MVLIQVTNNPSDEFVVSMPGTTKVGEVTAEVVRINNLRLRARRIVAGMKELALYGPMRPEELRGLSLEQIRLSQLSCPPGLTDMDPHALRVGIPPSAQLSTTLQTCAEELEASIRQVARVPQNSTTINDNISKCLGASMMAYPMGLPSYDPLHNALNNTEDLSNSTEGRNIYNENTAVLWFVGKKMSKTEELKKYSGNNEKAILKVKITPETAQAPQRETGVDAETQKKMMEFWHKKQKEEKELAEADDDSYLNSAWANPRGLKETVQGLGGIRFR